MTSARYMFSYLLDDKPHDFPLYLMYVRYGFIFIVMVGGGGKRMINRKTFYVCLMIIKEICKTF